MFYWDVLQGTVKQASSRQDMHTAMMVETAAETAVRLRQENAELVRQHKTEELRSTMLPGADNRDVGIVGTGKSATAIVEVEVSNYQTICPRLVLVGTDSPHDCWMSSHFTHYQDLTILFSSWWV